MTVLPSPLNPVGSINGHGGQSNLPVYSSTKGALMTMTKHAAWALRRDKIRANYLAVGWMYTPAEDALMQSEGSGPEWIDEADKNHPYGRLLRPVDIAKMVVHLLSEDSVMQSGGIIDCESTTTHEPRAPHSHGPLYGSP